MTVVQAIVGVDVGGTNTDAVVVDKFGGKLNVIASAKTHTTADVTIGVSRAIHLALINSKKDGRTLAVQQVNIGTTHFINAVIEGKRLAKVAVIRLCGTSSLKLPPFSDFTKFLKQIIQGSVYMINGGYQFDGKEITAVDEQEVVECVRTLKANGERNIVVCGIFSPVRPEQEERVLAIIKRDFPQASVTLSNKIGKIGILERENAAILNECIKPLCLETVKGFRQALEDLHLKCPMYMTQNDGTILNETKVLEYPVLSFACGATNSMRGAAFLSGLTDAIVADIGGTSCDVGILMKGLPREASSEVKVGGIRTNFRMPDVVSIGLGGGSYVQADAVVKGKKQVKVGPLSAGYKITSEALVFAEEGEISGRNITALDIAVAAGLTNLGEKNNVKDLKENFVKEAVDRIQDMLAACIDQMRFSDREMPLILVGGGSVIIDKSRKFDGVSEVIVPEHFDVANAVGSVLSQVSSTFDQVLNLESLSDKNAMDAKLSEEIAKKN